MYIFLEWWNYRIWEHPAALVRGMWAGHGVEVGSWLYWKLEGRLGAFIIVMEGRQIERTFCLD